MTTPLWTDGANIDACQSLWRFIHPQTWIRPERMAGSSMTSPAAGHAYGIEGSRAKPASSQYYSVIFPASSWCWKASSARCPGAKASGTRRDLKDFLTRFQRRRARLASRFRAEILRRFAVFWANRSTTCVRERGSSCIDVRASACSSGVRLGGRPLRG
jgi:hypothetical protein